MVLQREFLRSLGSSVFFNFHQSLSRLSFTFQIYFAVICRGHIKIEDISTKTIQMTIIAVNYSVLGHPEIHAFFFIRTPARDRGSVFLKIWRK